MKRIENAQGFNTPISHKASSFKSHSATFPTPATPSAMSMKSPCFLRKTAILSLYALLLVSCSNTTRLEQSATLEKFTTGLDNRIPSLMNTYDIPGAVIAIVQDGSPVWSGAYGYADVESERKMTTDTWCRMESISKPVTAWGVMKLVERGKIDLDRPVVDYLKHWSFPPASFSTETITVRQLLSHTSGLPLGTIGVRYDPRGEIPSLQAALSKDAIMMQEPGQSFYYSNTGFNILELLIEEATGRDFAAYMEEELFQPLGMQHATFNWRETFQPSVPNGYDLEGHPIPPYIYPDKAAGGLFARIDDIAAFVSAGMPGFSSGEQAVLTPGSIQKMYSPVAEKPGVYSLAFDSYGLGHFIEWLPNGRKAVSHGGQGSGWMTHFHAVPETGDGIIILTNSQRSWPFFAYLLNDWAAWRGFGSVGMGKIAKASRILWVIIGLLLLGAIAQIWRLFRGMTGGRRRFAPLARASRGPRILQGILALSIFFLLGWALTQEYLFIASVFPIASGWLGFALFAVSLVLLLSTLLPVHSATQLHGKN